MTSMLGKIDDIRHSRRFAHSHETPGFLFLSPEWSSCVRNTTQRKEKLARRTPENYSLGGCSNLELRNCNAALREYYFGASA